MATDPAAAAAVTGCPIPPKKIACGFYTSAAITNCNDGKIDTRTKVACWGRNHYNLQGHGKVSDDGGGNNKGLAFRDEGAPKIVRGGKDVLKSDIYEVSMGTNHTMFLRKRKDDVGGVLYGAGLGARYRLGVSKQVYQGEAGLGAEEFDESWWPEGPIRVVFNGSPNTRVLRVCCGADHTLCYTTDGYIYAWGANRDGQCGVGTSADVREPTRILALPKEKGVRHFAAGGQHSLLTTMSGGLYAWGLGKCGRLGLGAPHTRVYPEQVFFSGEVVLTSVACGEAHSAALDSSGLVWTWGAGSYGRLGQSEPEDTLVPKKVDTFEEMMSGGDLMQMQQIALGGYHSLFLETTTTNFVGHERVVQIGKLFSCGCGPATGLLGENDDSCVLVPRVIQDTKVFNSQCIVQMSAGMYHNLVLLEDGTLVTWGIGANGRLGDNSSKTKGHPHVLKTAWENTDQQIRGFALKKPVIPGADTGMAAADEQQQQQQQQQREQQPQVQPTLQDPSEGSALVEDTVEKRKENEKNDPWAIKQLGCGTLHSVALTRGGELYVWGGNNSGQLGMGPGDLTGVHFQWTPKKLSLTRLVVEVAVGAEHCLVVTQVGDMWAWGKGSTGQLGIGRARDEPEPILISSLTSFQVITCAAGAEHSACILREDKMGSTELWTWGCAENGVLGLGKDTVSSQFIPQHVEFEGGGIVASAKKKVRPQTNGASSPAVRQVEESLQVQPLHVQCGANHTAVITGSMKHLEDEAYWKNPDYMNRLWTFGGGWRGRLGLGSKDNAYSPTMVGVGRGGGRSTLLAVSVRNVSCGTYHTCMVSKESDLFVWGHYKLVCEPEDLVTPKKFVNLEGQHKVAYAACGEAHTYAILETGEVWVWGDNRHGQLGIGQGNRAELPIPEQAKFAPGAIGTWPGALAVGPTHAVGLFVNGEVWGWGNQSCGRLGLEDREQDKLVMEPKKVQGVWRSVESMSSVVLAQKSKAHGQMPQEIELAQENFVKGAIEALSKEQGKKQVVKDFATMQTLLQAERKECREKSLIDLERRLKEDLTHLEKDVKRLPEREATLTKVMSDLQQSFEKNLRLFRLPAPVIDDNWSNERFVARLPVYQEILRALQAQPCYIATILQHLTDIDDREVIYATIDGIYEEKSDSRTHMIFLMLLRQLVVKELEPSGSKLIDLFKEGSSHVFEVFSRYALSPLFYKEIVWNYLKENKSDPTSRQTLYTRLTSDENAIVTFACTQDEFTQRKTKYYGGGYRRGGVSDGEAFRLETEKFRDWLMDPFVKSVTAFDLPDSIQQFLAFVHLQSSQRQLELGVSIDAAISQDLTRFTPVLRLLIQCILNPILQDLQKYLGPLCYLPRRAKGDDLEETADNAAAVAAFLETMLEDSFDTKLQKELREAARIVRPELLRYMQEQVEKGKDTLETELMISTYVANYDIEPHTVSMQIGTLMKLSNLLREHAEKLSMRDKDPLVGSLSEVDDWDDASLQRAESDNRKYNFTMNHRFLLNSTVKAVICRGCKCPMPDNFGSRNSKPGMIMTLASEEEDSKNPRKQLEDILRELPFTVTSLSFKSLRQEFEEKRIHYKTNVQPPEIPTSNLLQEAVRVIDELQNVQTYPEDVLAYMSQSLLARSNHRTYLEQLLEGSKAIHGIQTRYNKDLQMRISEIRQAAEFSVDLELPPKFKEMATKANTTLDFANKQRELEHSRVVDPKAMPEGCAFSPLVQLTMRDMRRKKYLQKIHTPYETLEKKMTATFETTPNGAVQISVGYMTSKHNRNIVRQLVVEKDELERYQRMGEDETVDLGNPPLFTVHAANFYAFVAADLSKKVD